MKNLLSCTLIAFLLFASQGFAQESYTVNGEQLTLKTEVDGTITLLWNIIDGEYRYFIKKRNSITELSNTKSGKHFQEEYKTVLKEKTLDYPLATEKVNLITSSLTAFFEEYNALADPNYVVEKKSIQLKTRLGAFAGITNAVYSDNSTNQILPTLGLDFEIVDDNKLKRHSLVVQFKQTFESSEYKYSSSQFSLNYRFKFIKKEKLDVFINTKIAAYTLENIPSWIVDEDTDEGRIQVDSKDNFSALLSFGIGADYALGNGYLTFLYGDIVSAFDNYYNNEFPMDFTIGYKFNL